MAAAEAATGGRDGDADDFGGETRPRVTTLLAVYNGGAYLREAVESVLAQTYRDFELLVVDDGSTDGSIEALPRDPRIRVLRNERNLGQIPSLNRGLLEARGEYVARLDHDDVCLPRRLQLQVELLDRCPDVALAGTWVDVVDTRGRLWARARPTINSFEEFAADVVAGRALLVHPSLMFRREAVAAIGGFDETLNASEDQDLYRKLVLARHEARVVPETLLLYRRHEQQMTIAKSATVWESDGRSYDRFLLALAPETPATVLRLMLRSHPRFWTEPPLAFAQLEDFLQSASARLGLDAEGREVLARAVAGRARATILSGWAGDGSAGAFRKGAAPLGAFARRHGDPRDRLIGRATPILTITAPVGARLGGARRQLTRAARSDALARVRATARTSRLLRGLYARVVDTRPHD